MSVTHSSCFRSSKKNSTTGSAGAFHIKSEMITGGDQVREKQRKELNTVIVKNMRICRKTFGGLNERC